MGPIPSWFGTEVSDRDGALVGHVHDVYYDEATWRPAWLLVRSGMRLALVPAAGARSRRGTVVLAHDRAAVDASPSVVRQPALLAGEPLLRLARHYGVRAEHVASYAPAQGAAAA